ncbi:hypothetical protein Barb6_00830 [Bacteroidales bacterium Barb6]|nr:hypothetical protein Barb6_00830 [Bacteroidales bacterium Barb6]
MKPYQLLIWIPIGIRYETLTALLGVSTQVALKSFRNMCNVSN